MQDRNENTKKNLAEIWMEGFREVSEWQAKAQEYTRF